MNRCCTLLLTFLIVASFTIANNATASVFEPFFRQYSSKNGLPSSRVYQIKQDSKGFIWMATDNGVCRFDGNRFKNYTIANGLCVRTVFGIYEDESGLIWFYSYSGELVYYDHSDDSIHCPAFNKTLKEYTNGNILNGMFTIGDTIYTYDYKANIYKINRKNDSVILNAVTDLASLRLFDSSNFIFGYQNVKKRDKFILRIRKNKGNNYLKYDLYHDSNPYTLPSSIFDPSSECYFFTAKKRVIKYEPSSESLISWELEDKNTQSLYLDQYGSIWIGTQTKGVFAFDKNGQVRSQLLRDYMVTSILQDANGGYWFSTHDNGVFYSPNLEIEKLNYSAESTFTTASQILVIKKGIKDLFFSNAKGEVVRIADQGKGRIELIAKESRNFMDLYLDEDKYIKAESIPLELSNQLQNRFIKSVYELPNSRLILINQGNKLQLVEQSKNGYKTRYVLELKEKRLRHYQLTSDGSFYSGDYQSLWFYNSSKKEWKKILNESEDPNIEVTAIDVFKGDSIIASSRNSGVILLYNGKAIHTLDKRTHPLLENCNHIANDGSYLWISANEGLYRLKYPFSKNAIVKVINKSNGLPSDEVVTSMRFGSKIYLSTNEGLFRIDTSLFNFSPIKPKCRITSIELNDSNISNEQYKSIDLESGELRVKFSANSFANAFQIPFRYRLKDENQWIYTHEDFVELYSLEPSDYQFEVQAANENREWGESAFFYFVIEPKFWQTPLFLLLSIIFTLILSTLIYRNRIRQLKKMSKLENELVRTQNRALSAQMNPHFIFNSLNSISHGLLNNDTRTSVLYIGKFAKLMRSIFENSEETFIPLSEELSALTNYLELEQLRLQDKLEFKLKIDESIQADKIFVPALLLQPFVENAIWHGIAPLKDRSGIVKLAISKLDDSLAIRIIDDGVGMGQDRQEKQKSAIQTIKRRLKLIEEIYKRKIIFSMKPLNRNSDREGTEILLIIPLITSNPNDRT